MTPSWQFCPRPPYAAFPLNIQGPWLFNLLPKSYCSCTLPLSVDDNLVPEVKEPQNLRVVLFSPLSLIPHSARTEVLAAQSTPCWCFCSSLEVAAPSTILVRATITSHWNRSGGSNWPPCFHPASQPYHLFLTQRPKQSFSNINETILSPQ